MKKIMIFRKALSLLLALTLLCGIFAGSGFSVHASAAVSIGDTAYESLEAAVESARQGDIIVLNSDVTVSSTITINGKAVYITSAGDGYSVRRAPDFSGAIFDIDSGDLGIYSGVTIDGEGRSVSSTLVRVDGGSFSMDSGCSIIGNSIDVAGGAAVNVNSGSFSFMGGNISSSSSVAVYIGSSAIFRMAGDAGFGSGSALYLGGTSYIEIPSAITLGSDLPIYADNLSDGRAIAQLSGGISLTAEQLSRFKMMGTDDSYSVVQSGTQIVVHKESAPEVYTEVVEYNGQKYDNLNDAISEVKEEYATLYLLKSFSVNYNTVITGDRNIYIVPKTDAVISRAEGYLGAMFTVQAGTTLTLGGTLQINGSGIAGCSPAFEVMGGLTLENGVIITNHNSSSAVISVSSGTFTMNGGSLNGNVASNGIANLSSSHFTMNSGQIKSNKTVNGGGVYADASTVNINGGDICFNSASNGGGVYIAKGSMSMSGGRIYGNTAGSGASVYTNGVITLSGSAAIAANSSMSVYLGADALINVAEGWSPETLSGYSKVVSVGMNEYKLNRVVVSFASAPVADAFVLDESHSSLVLKAVGNNLVVAPGNEGDVAYFNNRGYATLEEAFAAVPENGAGTVYLVGDAQVAQTIVIKPAQKLTLSVTARPGATEEFTGRNITRFEGFDGAIFDVSAGATFAVGAPEGKLLTIDGASVIVKDSAFVVKGVLDIGVGASIVNHNFIGTENAAEGVFTYGGGVRVENGGVCMLSGGTVSGCYASYGGGIALINGTFTLSKGYISSNTALFGGGLYALTVKSEDDQTATENMAMPLLRSIVNISDGIITQNKAISNTAVPYSGMGGGILAGSGSYCSVTGGSVNENTAVYGGGVSVGEVPTVDEKSGELLSEPCDFILSDKAYIAPNNDVYIAYPELYMIKVMPELKSQTSAITITLPDWLPANIPVVQYIREIPPIDPMVEEQPAEPEENNPDASEFTAQPALDKPLFKLDETAAKYFTLLLSENDPTVIIAGIKNGSFGGVESGKVFDGLKRFEEADGIDEPIPVVYEPVTLGTKGVFTAHYEFIYPTALYSGFTRSVTAPFPKGTYITLIDYNVKGNASYYYYKVTGEEQVVKGENLASDLPEGEAPVYTPDVIEIPLEEFMRMGTDNQYYINTNEVLFDTEAEFNTERMVFIVDFTYAELDEGYTAAGDFRMEWNHYVPSYNGILCDITGYACYADYSVVDDNLSEAYIETDKSTVLVSYTLGADSLAANRNCGVILLRLNGRYPAGTYFTDADENIYSVPARSSVAVIPIPHDSRGNIIRRGELELTVANYYGTSIPDTDIYAMLCASNDGEHYSAFTQCDAESDYVVLNLPARDKYAVLVTNSADEEKPFFDGLSSINESKFLEMNVKATMNSAEVSEFTLFLQKKTDDGYENCPLSELFKIEDQEVMSVSLATGKISLEPVDNLEALLGNEFKIGFSVGDKTEFVKVNVTKD